jgi:hypothetical protein
VLETYRGVLYSGKPFPRAEYQYTPELNMEIGSISYDPVYRSVYTERRELAEVKEVIAPKRVNTVFEISARYLYLYPNQTISSYFL